MLRILPPTFKPDLLQDRFKLVVKHRRNIAIQLVLQQCCETSCMYVGCFSVPYEVIFCSYLPTKRSGLRYGIRLLTALIEGDKRRIDRFSTFLQQRCKTS